MKIKLLSISIFIFLVSVLYAQDREACVQALIDFRNTSLKYRECTDGIKPCPADVAKRLHFTRLAAFNRFQSNIDNGKCLKVYNDLSDKEWRFILSCPADALITNSAGKQIGWRNGILVNEIPKAEKIVDAESEMYTLPLYDAYRIEIIGTGKGSAEVYTVFEESNGEYKTYYFDLLPLHSGIRYSGTIEAGGKINNITSGTSTFSPQSRSITSNDPLFSKINSIGKVQDNRDNNNLNNEKNEPNRPPNASFIMMPESPSKHDKIVLVSSSLDPDGDDLSYEWYVNNSYQGSGKRIEISSVEKGIHIFKLVVDDGRGQSAFIQKSIEIVDADGDTYVEDNEWDTPFWDDLLYYLPYALGGLIGLVFLRLIFRKKTVGNTTSSTDANEKRRHPRASQLSPRNKPQNDPWIDVRFCSQCGNSVEVGKSFCGKCGAQIDYSQ